MNCFRRTIFLMTIGFTNAQLIPNIFNTFFSGIFIGTVNNIGQTFLQTLDPYQLNLQQVVNLASPQECTGLTQMQVVTNFFSGISGAGFSELEMECFQLLPRLIVGFRAQAIAPMLETSFTSKIVSQSPNCTSKTFAGNGEARNSLFDFSFEADFTFLPNFSLQKVTIAEMSLTMPTIRLDLPDLGTYESIKENITDEIDLIIDNVVEKRFNKTMLEDSINSNLPFVIF